MSDAAAPDPRARRRLGLAAAAVVFAVYGGMALTIDVPAAAHGFKSDEATYYLIGHSLARDGDLEYRRADLERRGTTEVIPVRHDTTDPVDGAGVVLRCLASSAHAEGWTTAGEALAAIEVTP